MGRLSINYAFTSVKNKTKKIVKKEIVFAQKVFVHTYVLKRLTNSILLKQTEKPIVLYEDKNGDLCC